MQRREGWRGVPSALRPLFREITAGLSLSAAWLFVSVYPPKRNLTGASLLVFVWQANGHSFVHMEHEKAVLLLKSFQNTVDLVIQRELAV